MQSTPCYILSCGREMRMVAKQRTYRYSQSHSNDVIENFL